MRGKNTQMPARQSRFISANIVDMNGQIQFRIKLTSWAKIIITILGLMPVIVTFLLLTLIYINNAEIKTTKHDIKIQNELSNSDGR